MIQVVLKTPLWWVNSHFPGYAACMSTSCQESLLCSHVGASHPEQAASQHLQTPHPAQECLQSRSSKSQGLVWFSQSLHVQIL